MPYVYVLSNPVMPGLVKIGKTDQNDVSDRIAQLYTTGVPVPFTLEFACRVPNADEVEKAFHIAFAPQRVNARREFFQIEPEQAVVILKLLHVEDATAEIELQATQVDAQSVAAGEQFRSRRPNLNFEEMGIPVGAALEFAHGPTAVTVAGAKKVRFDEKEWSLSAVTRQLLGVDYSVAPGPHWSYNGRRLWEIYEDTYGGE